MDVTEVIFSRHSVRRYKDIPIEEEKRGILDALAKEITETGGISARIVYDEEKAFSSAMARYGSFKGVRNYICLFGDKKSDEKIGFYGQKLVIKAQETGLNTCWVALTFDKGFVKKNYGEGRPLRCVIALGYGETQGKERKSKTEKDVTDIKGKTPENFDVGVKAALSAPTAVNQQKFRIICKDEKVSIVKSGLGFYTDMDLGIVKYNFQTASGIKVFEE